MKRTFSRRAWTSASSCSSASVTASAAPLALCSSNFLSLSATSMSACFSLILAVQGSSSCWWTSIWFEKSAVLSEKRSKARRRRQLTTPRRRAVRQETRRGLTLEAVSDLLKLLLLGCKSRLELLQFLARLLDRLLVVFNPRQSGGFGMRVLRGRTHFLFVNSRA